MATKGPILVLHDNHGLTEHYSDVVGRFAGAGFSALCVDLLSAGTAGGPTGTGPSPAAAVKPVPPDLVSPLLRAGITELSRRVPGRRVGAVGFGLGGEQIWQLLASGDERIAAAVPFYGMAPDGLDLTRAKSAVLALYGEDDDKVRSSQDTADLAMSRSNLEHHSVFYPHAGHGFFVDTSPDYNLTAATQAWHATIEWLDQHVPAATAVGP